MYRINKHKLINPAQIASIDYKTDEVVDESGVPQGHIAIQMVNQTGNMAFLIEGPANECEEIASELIELVKKCNNDFGEEEVPTILTPPKNKIH